MIGEICSIIIQGVQHFKRVSHLEEHKCRIVRFPRNTAPGVYASRYDATIDTANISILSQFLTKTALQCVSDPWPEMK